MSTTQREPAQAGTAQAEGYAVVEAEAVSRTITGCVPITSTPDPSEASRNEAVKWVIVLSEPAAGTERMTFAEAPAKVFTAPPPAINLTAGQTTVLVSTVISSTAVVGTAGALMASVGLTSVSGAVLIV